MRTPTNTPRTRSPGHASIRGQQHLTEGIGRAVGGSDTLRCEARLLSDGRDVRAANSCHVG